MRVVYGKDGKPAMIGRDAAGEPTVVTDGGTGVLFELDAQRPHALGYVVCRECGHWHLGVVDIRANLTRLRCNGCNRRTGEMQPERPGDVVPVRPTMEDS